jgi:tRNA threonylcarbamoyladenosine biosynthesis protein TsaE
VKKYLDAEMGENRFFGRNCPLMDYEIAAINEAAQWVLEQAGSRRVIAFFAPMGAGKTTLSGAILKAMGVASPTSSPTFSIVNEYGLAHGASVYHMDWYRLRDQNEAIDAGIEDHLYSGSYCLIEWPERAPLLLPADTLRVGIGITGPQSRRLHIIKEH